MSRADFRGGCQAASVCLTHRQFLIVFSGPLLIMLRSPSIRPSSLRLDARLMRLWLAQSLEGSAARTDRQSPAAVATSRHARKLITALAASIAGLAFVLRWPLREIPLREQAHFNSTWKREPVDDDVIQEAIAAYSRVNAVLEPLRIQVWEAYGLTVTQLRLMHLIRQKQAPSLRDLAAELGISSPTISGLVDRLVLRQIVERRHDEVDRRIVRVSLTQEGESLSRALEHTGRAVLGQAFEAIGPAATRRLTLDLAAFATAVQAVLASEAAFLPAAE